MTLMHLPNGNNKRNSQFAIVIVIILAIVFIGMLISNSSNNSETIDELDATTAEPYPSEQVETSEPEPEPDTHSGTPVENWDEELQADLGVLKASVDSLKENILDSSDNRDTYLNKIKFSLDAVDSCCNKLEFVYIPKDEKGLREKCDEAIKCYRGGVNLIRACVEEDKPSYLSSAQDRIEQGDSYLDNAIMIIRLVIAKSNH